MGSKSPQTVTQTNAPPPEVMAQYRSVIGRANQVANQPYEPYKNNLVAPLNDAQVEAINFLRAGALETGNVAGGLAGAYTRAGDVYGGLGSLQSAAQGVTRAVNDNAGVWQPYYGDARALTGQGAGAVRPMAFSGDQVARYLSPYQQNVIDATLANIQRNDAISQRNVMSNAIRSGNAFGGDRMGLAQAELARNQALASNQVIAGLQNAGYTQALQQFNTQQALDLSAQQNNAARALQAGAQMGQLGSNAQQAALMAPALALQGVGMQGNIYGQQLGALGAQNAISGQQIANNAGLGGLAGQYFQAATAGQQADQRVLDAAYQQWQNAVAFPYQQTSWLGQLSLGAGGQMGSTSTSQQPSPNNTGSILGGLLGLGGLFLRSDRRVKENVRAIGATFDGQPIYRYRYADDPTPRIGLMAQDVERRHPEAVREIDGIKAVDYARATADAARRGHFAHGGPVHRGPVIEGQVLRRAVGGVTPGMDARGIVPNVALPMGRPLASGASLPRAERSDIAGDADRVRRLIDSFSTLRRPGQPDTAPIDLTQFLPRPDPVAVPSTDLAGGFDPLGLYAAGGAVDREAWTAASAPWHGIVPGEGAPPTFSPGRSGPAPYQAWGEGSAGPSIGDRADLGSAGAGAGVGNVGLGSSFGGYDAPGSGYDPGTPPGESYGGLSVGDIAGPGFGGSSGTSLGGVGGASSGTAAGLAGANAVGGLGGLGGFGGGAFGGPAGGYGGTGAGFGYGGDSFAGADPFGGANPSSAPAGTGGHADASFGGTAGNMDGVGSLGGLGGFGGDAFGGTAGGFGGTGGGFGYGGDSYAGADAYGGPGPAAGFYAAGGGVSLADRLARAGSRSQGLAGANILNRLYLHDGVVGQGVGPFTVQPYTQPNLTSLPVDGTGPISTGGDTIKGGSTGYVPGSGTFTGGTQTFPTGPMTGRGGGFVEPTLAAPSFYPGLWGESTAGSGPGGIGTSGDSGTGGLYAAGGVVEPEDEFGHAPMALAPLEETRPMAPAAGTDAFHRALIQQESGGRNVGNTRSSAFGPAQFTRGTWRDVIATPEGRAMGLTEQDRYNPDRQIAATPIFTRMNAAALERAGVPANPRNLYLAHFLGAGAAPAFYRAAMASPDAPAMQFVSPEAARANPTVFFNRDGTPRSAADVYERQTRRFADLDGAGVTAFAAPQTPGLASAGLDATGLAAARLATPDNRSAQPQSSLPRGLISIPGFELSDDTRMGLLAAGLAMMASRSPNAGQQIGEGGLAGLQAMLMARQGRGREELQQAEAAALRARTALQQAQEEQIRQNIIRSQRVREATDRILRGGSPPSGARTPAGDAPPTSVPLPAPVVQSPLPPLTERLEPSPSAPQAVPPAAIPAAPPVATPISSQASPQASPRPPRPGDIPFDDIHPTYNPRILPELIELNRGYDNAEAARLQTRLDAILASGRVVDRQGRPGYLPGHREEQEAKIARETEARERGQSTVARETSERERATRRQQAIDGGMDLRNRDVMNWINAGGTPPADRFRNALDGHNAKLFSDLAQTLPEVQDRAGLTTELAHLVNRVGTGVQAWLQFQAGRFGMPGGGDVQAMQALIERLVPAQRQGLPGAASDRDVAMFRASLPSLMMQPNGAALVIQTMRNLVQNDMRRVSIANEVARGDRTMEDGLRALNELPNAFSGVRQFLRLPEDDRNRSPVQASQDAANDPLRPAPSASQAQQQNSPPILSSAAEIEKLPSGSTFFYRLPDGRLEEHIRN